ncbi:MAG: SDR family oxidoreductase [Caulobacterales bacterium]
MDPFESVSLKGRAIVITGAGSGIGRAAALLMAGRGARLIVADIDFENVCATAQHVKANGGIAVPCKTNIADENEVEHMVALAVSEFGGLDGAFNNAAVNTKGIPLVEMSRSEFQHTIDVNLSGTFFCLKHEIAYMAAHGGGAIVNTSSGAGVVAAPHSLDYVASKHGVIGLTKAAALDYCKAGVRVNAVLPGGVDTPMLRGAMNRDADVRAIMENGHLLGRLARPMEIAEAAAWLLSDATSFMTGSTVLVDGGYTCV